MRAALVYGTAAPAGRLAKAMEAFRAGLEAEAAAVTVADLSAEAVPAAGSVAPDRLAEGCRRMLDAVGLADAVVLFSPVYRAAAPGALKNLLDMLPVEALENKPVGIVSMGATPHHFLGVEESLRAALAWFGCVIVPPCLYLTSRSFDAGAPTAEAAAEIAGYARTVADMTRRLAGLRIAPRPLAARERG